MLDQEFYRLTLIFVNLKLFEQLETGHPKHFQSIIGIFLLSHFFSCIKKKFNNVTKYKKRQSKNRPPEKSLNVDFVGIA